MLRFISTLLLAVCPLLTHGQASNDFQNQCLNFNPVSLVNNSTLRLLEHVPANTTLPLPGMDKSCGRTSQKVAKEICRVALTIPTSNRSSIIFELWLPHPDDWNAKRRFLGTGNGGIDGCTKYEDLAYGVQNGFATTGSNNGHNGTGGQDFLNNPDIVTDFSFRSLHTTAVAGKNLTKAFYGPSPSKSYYIGCSGGGRQAIQAASLYPDDYDGIVAGCPAANFNFMSAWRMSFFTITGAKNSSDFIKPETWTGPIHNEIMRQCDGLDGVEDGVIADTSICNFRPEALLCGSELIGKDGDQAQECLNPKQVDIVRRVYAPLYGEDGQMIYPGLQPGAEVQAIQRLLAGTPFPFSEDWFKYVVYSDPGWSPSSFTIHDAAVTEKLNPSNCRAWPDTLAPFRDRGGKIVVFHGGADNQITGFDTERFYNHLSTSMAATSTDLDTFFRFFRVPGMFHCSGGPGAWQIGQSGAEGVMFQPEVNVLAAAVEWVEGSKAPDTMLGTKYVNDTVGRGIEYQRRHCRYPLRSTFVGGNSSSVDSWTCK